MDRVEEVDEFTVSNKGGSVEDIQARIRKARQAFAMLRPIWRSAALTTKAKLRVFGSNVKAVLLYGSETWRLTKGMEQKLQVFINKSLRNILRGFRGLEKSATRSFGDKQSSDRSRKR